jgi:BirA family biotin operon repressor/biotin-[acetyl-CoA-carboxylase] ligase
LVELKERAKLLISLHKLFKNTAFIGKKALFLPSCHSTNDVAAQLLADQQATNGSVIYTDFQHDGKGQRGNKWESDDGKNILLSTILQTDFIEASSLFDLTIMTSLALYDFLAEYLHHEIKIKWPNDLYYTDRKIAGILIENYVRKTTIDWCILGIGININQRTFHVPKAISLTKICGQSFDRDELVSVLLQKLERRYFHLKEGKTKRLRTEYVEHLYWHREKHLFRSENGAFAGTIIGVDKMGKLIVDTAAGQQYFDFKEITFVS